MRGIIWGGETRQLCRQSEQVEKAENYNGVHCVLLRNKVANYLVVYFGGLYVTRQAFNRGRLVGRVFRSSRGALAPFLLGGLDPSSYITPNIYLTSTT